MLKRPRGVKRTRPKSAQEWIEHAKEKAGIETDGEMGRTIGASKQAISNYQQGRNAIGAREAIKIGWLIDEDPIQIIIESALVASGGASDWASLLEEYRKRKAVEEPEGQRGEPQTAKKRVTEPTK